MFTNALVMASLLPLSPVNWNSDVTADFLVVDVRREIAWAISGTRAPPSGRLEPRLTRMAGQA